MVIKSPSSPRAPAYQNTDTHARVVTPIAKQHKQKAILIKATSLNTGSILLFHCAPNAFKLPPPLPFSLALTCPVVSRLCVRPIVARTSVGAWRASASKRRIRAQPVNRSKPYKYEHLNGGREECVHSAERLSKRTFCPFPDPLTATGDVNSLHSG